MKEQEKSLQSKMAEIAELTEENDKLSEQLASAIERPKGIVGIFLIWDFGQDILSGGIKQFPI